MIAEQYINEGLRIRKAYIQNLKEILKQEPIILERKNFFEKIKEMRAAFLPEPLMSKAGSRPAARKQLIEI